VTAESIRLAVLGDPLAYTLSPDLHRAGLEAVGLEGESAAFRTPPDALGARLEDLAARGYRGANLTAPLKHAALAHLKRVSERARRARSVNTVGFGRDGWWGETTDGLGFIALLRSLGRRPADERALMLGAGGASRSLALALGDAGCRDVTASARRPEAAAESWREIPGAALEPWPSSAEPGALVRATLVVNATPLEEPVTSEDLEHPARGVLLIDLRYGARVTPWVMRARAAGLEAYDGLGLLVFQARGSLSLWTGLEVPIDPLARAVGWPR
jgi:shikimate dehydrogenase